MKKLIKSILMISVMYAGYKVFDYSVLKAICESQRKELIAYANGNNIDSCPFYKMNCEEIKSCWLYVFDYLKYDISLKVDNDLYNKVSTIIFF
jgi:hypothetical protein